MAKTAQSVCPEEMAAYRRTAHARWERERMTLGKRRERAWEVARSAARMLREEFGARRIIAFGSLAHGAWFTSRSDIDLAVEGLPPGVIWKAWSKVERALSEFEIDLIEVETTPESLWKEIEKWGISL